MRFADRTPRGVESWTRIVYWSAILGVPLAYAIYTNHAWEDFFITFRHSRNLVEGHGLVYQPGERVHGFTSPLNVLLPALTYWLTGSTSFQPALWLYRVLSIAALAAGGAALLGALRQSTAAWWPAILFAALALSLEPKIVMFTVNGQEAGLMLLFFLPALVWCLTDPLRRWTAIGVCWAGLMWTRPDGCIYIAVIALVALGFAGGDRIRVLAALMRAALLCTGLYLPWFLWAWWYYGSPVPHTVLAKAALHANDANGLWASAKDMFEKAPYAAKLVFLPTNAQFGGWPVWTDVYAWAAAGFCALYWLAPWADNLGRRLSLVFLLIVVYLSYLAHAGGVYAWYTPPAAAVGIAVITLGVPVTVSRFISDVRIARYLASGVLAAALCSCVTVFAMTTVQMRVQQRVIEFGNRMQIGLWLKEHASAGDRVFLEPLGYIGYFSGAHMLDYPGLASPEVTRLLELGSTPGEIVAALAPEWLVLRRSEAENLLAYPAIRSNYHVARVFDVRAALQRYGKLPGSNYLRRDAVFLVFRRG
jgi:hypothetical protein